MEEHKCLLLVEEDPQQKLRKFQKLRLITSENPLSLGNFRSEHSILNEQMRHLRVNKRAIHPFSKFKAWCDMFSIYLYLSVVLTKPLDAAFMRKTWNMTRFTYRMYSLLTDILCWVDIVINFYTGYEVQGEKIVELRRWYIAKHYIFSQYFICDVLSSIPKGMIYYIPYSRAQVNLLATISFIGLFKVVRIVSLINCIRNTAEYLEIKSKGSVFLLCTFVTSFVIVHWLACLQFTVPRFARLYYRERAMQNRSSWFFEDKGKGPLYYKGVFIQYIHCFFKATAYVLGIRITLYELQNQEEYILVVATYFIGKIMIGFIWIILAVTILNCRLMDIKFAEIINQLEEYMKQKQLPLNLRDRILHYFVFKYRGRYFQEELITSLLSDSIRKDANLHACKSLIKNVSLFSELSIAEISKIVDFLTPEIYLPNDTIIHAGTQGDAMYFISSGTVAVYTRSGKEICHLQDGAFFGEVSLVLKGQIRLTTIVALETTQVYRLGKKDFEKNLFNKKHVMTKILTIAEMRLKEATRMEEEYKEMLFEQSYRRISSSN